MLTLSSRLRQTILVFVCYHYLLLFEVSTLMNLQVMMAQACYRPEAAMEFWNRMDKMAQGAPPQVLSTHPSSHNRGEKIREWLPKAHEKAEMSDCANTMDYGRLTMTILCDVLSFGVVLMRY
jgi:hypothetical protein